MTDYTDPETGEVTPGLLTYCRQMIETLAPIVAVAVGINIGARIARAYSLAAMQREFERGHYLFGGSDEEE